MATSVGRFDSRCGLDILNLHSYDQRVIISRLPKWLVAIFDASGCLMAKIEHVALLDDDDAEETRSGVSETHIYISPRDSPEALEY